MDNLLFDSSTFPTVLTSEIISADVFQIFLHIIILGIILGIFIGLIIRATWWIW